MAESVTEVAVLDLPREATEKEPQVKGPKEGAGEPGPAYALRQGVVMLSTDCNEKRSNEALLGGVCDALKADSRVKDFDRPRFRAHASRREEMFPLPKRTNDDDVLYGADHFHAVTFSDPIVFQVAVSPESQEEFRGYREFPEGNYFVAWDGLVLIVLWEQSSDKGVSRAAGRIIVDILREAVAKAGCSVFVQSCSPGCKNLFTHTDAMVVAKGNKVLGSREGRFVVEQKELRSADEELRHWYRHIGYPFLLFAHYKNRARRIRDLAALSNQRLAMMLSLRQKHQSLPVLERKERRGARKTLKGWRKKTQKSMADVWLASASIEVMRGAWDEDRRRFKEQIADNRFAPLFASDYSDDEAAVDAIDLSMARAALDHTSAGLDTRLLVIATSASGAAALVGGVVGALIAS